jgi:hypothetical protein
MRAEGKAMAFSIRRIEYFRTIISDDPGEGFSVLSGLASQGINLLAFSGVPHSDRRTELTLYPDSAPAFARTATAAGMELEGPLPALLVQGDDELGALASIHRALARAQLNVVAATGVADGRGAFGYVIHMRPADVDSAVGVLNAFSAGHAER